MGTGCSKEVVGTSRGRRGPSLRSFCSGGCSYSLDHDDDPRQRKQNGRTEPGGDQTMRESDKIKKEGFLKGEGLGTIQVSSVSSNVEFSGWIHEAATSDQSVAGNCSITADHIGISLNRPTSLGSSEAYSLLSSSRPISDPTAVFHASTCLDDLGSHSNVLGDGNLCAPGLRWLNSSNGFHRIDSSSDDLQLHPSAKIVQQLDHVMPSFDNITTHSSVTMPELAVNGPSLESYSGTAQDESVHACRRAGTTESLQTGMQFGRTLSVGRFRDRVLQRNVSSVVPFDHMEDDDAVGDVSQGTVPDLYDLTSEVVQQNAEIPHMSSSHDFGGSSIRPSNGSHQLDVGNQQLIDATDDNPSSHRMTFLERRQRVRSQVRALHRLGSRFENLVGHDRSCILSGQHRRGRCLCRANIRPDSTEGDTNTRASISRIVMLAEALFDVLDEIHQQSVVLSSWPSVSSLGSVPAPKEVVEHLPVKVYTNSGLKNEEAAQCYICLVEYDEGDCLRILPCHHMFHQSCVDKWLKEVHRVCPLCRGNICTSDSLPLETVG
ncbi:Receptor-like proteiny region transmembrane domain- and RING domain-containing protein 6 [Nymphaea thermarum]|nr:Receptor-like proteiny region transmembrane domain- and RING domain-containing protein 6 [Nymphaea thermarum]